MPAKVGSVVSLYYDSPRQVVCSDVLKTPTGRMYLILEVRIQQRGAHQGRQHLKALVVDTMPEKHGAIYPIYWYRR